MTDSEAILQTTSLKLDADYLAPDGSEIRLLPTMKGGGLSHCTLPAGRTSSPVAHRQVEEIWFVVRRGRGLAQERRSGSRRPTARSGGTMTDHSLFYYPYRICRRSPESRHTPPRDRHALVYDLTKYGKPLVRPVKLEQV